MKTKIIPFDLETAKKIQAGEIEGKVYFKIKTADRSETYTFNLKTIHRISNLLCSYYGVFDCDGEEYVQYIKSNGYIPEQLVTLTIEVPDTEPEFKPFDEVLVRDYNNSEWCLALYAYYSKQFKVHRMVGGPCWIQCIPYKGNEHLLGTTNSQD